MAFRLRCYGPRTGGKVSHPALLCFDFCIQGLSLSFFLQGLVSNLTATELPGRLVKTDCKVSDSAGNAHAASPGHHCLKALVTLTGRKHFNFSNPCGFPTDSFLLVHCKENVKTLLKRRHTWNHSIPVSSSLFLPLCHC